MANASGGSERCRRSVTWIDSGQRRSGKRGHTDVIRAGSNACGAGNAVTAIQLIAIDRAGHVDHRCAVGILAGASVAGIGSAVGVIPNGMDRFPAAD